VVKRLDDYNGTHGPIPQYRATCKAAQSSACPLSNRPTHTSWQVRPCARKWQKARSFAEINTLLKIVLFLRLILR